MSHVTNVGVEIKDLECLKRACEKLGLEFVEGQKTYRWYGRHVGDYPLPAGFSKEDLGHCEHAIRVPGKPGAYEVGVMKRRDGKEGYTLQYDFWGGGYGLQDAIGINANRLLSRYSAEVGMQVAMAEGWTLLGENVDENGNVEVLYQG